jgi:hypothetical protein
MGIIPVQEQNGVGLEANQKSKSRVFIGTMIKQGFVAAPKQKATPRQAWHKGCKKRDWTRIFTD